VIVVDTSVLVDFFRGRDTSGCRTLTLLEEHGIPFAIPAICCQELLQGARDEAEWRLLLEYLESQRRLVPHDPHAAHVAAARLYYECRRQGVTPRSTIDCSIAQLVIDADAELLQSDGDFEEIAKIHRLRLCRPVATDRP
jgi:predicted nucleic acid-binding protein